MTDVLADVRSSIRTLRRSPWFAVLSVLTLGLGIGGTVALFSLVDAVLVRDLPYRRPHQLVEIWGRDNARAGMRIPGPVLAALREKSRMLQAIGTHDPSAGVLNRPEESVDIRGETVSSNFVAVFGVPPITGRGFVPEDEQADAPAVMLVSFGFWRHYLGGDASAAGRVVQLDGVPYTVIGIMPAGFETRFLGARPEFWTVYAGSRSREREKELGYEVVARLADGATIDQARQEIAAIAGGVQVPGWRDAGRRIELVPLMEEVVGNRAYALTLLLTGIAVVLAVACANLAQLMLARSDHRMTEFATRKAIGAGTVQLFRLALTESLLLSLAGGVAGVALAYWLVPAMRALAPSEIPRLADATVDLRVLASALAISLLTGCAFGLVPALRLSRLSLLHAMKPSAGPPSRQRARFRSALVVTQVAAAVTLLALAGLLVRTFLTLVPSSPGFATRSRAAFIWSIRESQFADPADRRRRVNDLIQRLETSPGVVKVAVASGMPFGDDEPLDRAVRPAGDTAPVSAATLRADFRAVSSGFPNFLQIPVVEGRAFDAGDRADAPRVAMINRTLARRLGSGSTVGQSIRVGNGATAPVYQIVGVIADTRWWGTTLAPLNEVYIPFEQDRALFGFVLVQSDLDMTSITRAIRTAFHAVLPGAALPAARMAVPLDEMVGRSVAGPRFNAMLAGAFSALTTILAVIGLFGLVGYSVSQRRQELGIRAALGASPRDLIAVTMRSALVLTAIGILTGLSIGLYLTRFVESQLYAVERLDARTFAGAAILMMLAAGLASYWPARRAAHADPMRALRVQ
jgi:putative ABC transport system permease protein